MHKFIGSIVVVVLFMAAINNAAAAFKRQTSGSCGNGNVWVSTTWFDDNGNPTRVAGVNCDGEPYDQNLRIRPYVEVSLPLPTWADFCLNLNTWQATVTFDANYNSTGLVGANCMGDRYVAYY